jgi:cytochrome c oxidase assembly factor CtaG
MSPVVDAFLYSWPFDPLLIVTLALSGIVYLRGWLALRGRNVARWHGGRLVAFLAGLAAIYLALASPIEPFSYFFLQIHMVQHLLLMMAAPPLLWLGEPLFPMLRGLPAPIRIYWVAPCFRVSWLRRLMRKLAHPVTAWVLYVAATWLWHVPRFYDFAIRNNGWHWVQHLTFLCTALLFWYPVVRPYPSRPRWSLWLLFPYLILADLQNTVLSALLTFSDRVVYRYYAEIPRLNGISALDDQATAGVLMWVPGSIAFLVPLFWIGTRALFGMETRERMPQLARAKEPIIVDGCRRIALPMVTLRAKAAPEKWDLLHVPGLGRLLRWRHARLCFQLPLVLLAIAVIYDGWTGPEVAPMNLAGVLPWTHWRGLLMIALLIAGNVFCMACPFTVPRIVARRFASQRFDWPRWLRNKWLAAGLIVLFLWTYEAYALWDSPWLTAWIAAGYFTGALVIDSVFRGAAFCKYVCPIGQFNFVQSLVSPWEVRARDHKVCAACQTKDCIRDCELHLNVPRKASNFDCTFCLDCIHACPHDNIGITAGPPGAALWFDGMRSEVARLGKRPDVAALIVILVFGSFANAAGMVGPVADWQDAMSRRWGHATPYWAITVYYVLTLVVLPVLAVGAAAWIGRWWSNPAQTWREAATRQVYALVPLGFAMWLSHYSFHLLTSYDTALPVIQRFVSDCGAKVGTPEWSYACCRPLMDWIPRLEIIFLDVGLLLSLYTSYRIAMASTDNVAQVCKAVLPWAILLLVMFAVGIWIVLQPMQMRGTMLMAG